MRFWASVIVAMLACSSAFAEWRSGERQEFNGACVQSCARGQSSPGEAVCTRYCQCVQSTLEAAYPDAQAFGTAFNQQDQAAVQQVNQAGQTCRQRLGL